METRRQDRDILSHQFRGQQGGGTSTHVAPWCERDISIYKNKEYKKAKRERDSISRVRGNQNRIQS